MTAADSIASPQSLRSRLPSLAIDPSPPRIPPSPSLSPTRPEKSPLRRPGGPDVDGSLSPRIVLARIRELSAEVAQLPDSMYEIQELRHSTFSTSSAASPPSSRLDTLVSHLDLSVDTLPARLSALESDVGALGPDAPVEPGVGLQALRVDTDALTKQHAALKDEMKEDGWLVRFRATADQAEAMMDPLQSSMMECLRYVESVTTSPVPVPFESELEELPSIKTLQTLAKRHEAMKGTYMPSVSKILKMMDKSIDDRATKSGEALRRFGDMSLRWATVQKQLRQLDARIRIVLGQRHSALSSPNGVVEYLADGALSQESSPTEYYGLARAQAKTPKSHASVSSGTSRSSLVRSLPHKGSAQGMTRTGTGPAKLSPDDAAQQSVRRRASFMSVSRTSTASTAERSIPLRSVPSTLKTPTNKRVSSVGRVASPTPSHESTNSSAMSYPGANSRIPVLSPKSQRRFGTSPPPVPTIAVPSAQHFVNGMNASNQRHHMARGAGLMNTPEPTRRVSDMGSKTGPRASINPAMAFRPHLSASVPRASLSRGPPSSYRSVTPTPLSRPSSRLSMHSYAPSMAAPPNLQPFTPSKYDLLDMAVQTIIDEVGFDMYVARVDQALKKGQRRVENQEWKGEFVFGAGEKTSSVKLLKLAGRSGQGEGLRQKCLVRLGGAWQDLSMLLIMRLENAPRQEFESP